MTVVKMTPSEAITEVLIAEKINHVTGIVGSAFMDLLDLFPSAGIKFIPVRHEQSAGHMEDAYSRITGTAGVVIGQNGPGITNLVTSVAAANMAHSPLVVIAPSASSQTVGWDGFQEVDTLNMFRPITKAVVKVTNPKRAAEVLRTAFRIAYAERGAVLYDIPRDYFYGELEEEILQPYQYRVDQRGCGNLTDINKAAELLSKAKKPVIISGRGAVDSKAIDIIEQIATKLSAPVAVSYLHNDAFPANNPHWVGPIGYMGSKAAMYSLQEADVILAIGTRLSVFGTLPTYDIKYFTGNAKIIQININPLHIARTHPIEIGIIGDAKLASQEILNHLNKLTPNHKINQERLDTIKKYQEDWDLEITNEAMIKGKKMNPRHALLELNKNLPDNAIVSTDIGNVSSIANSYLRFSKNGKHIAALTLGNTGFAYPAALGAQLALPNAPVFAIIGDGAWGMSLHEVSTAVEQNLPVIACVFKNNAWAAEMKNQVDFYNNRFVGCDIPVPESFVPVAKAMGAEGFIVTSPDQIKDVMAKAIALRKPVVIELIVDGTMLAPPFRRDALAKPIRLLPKYAHLDHRNI